MTWHGYFALEDLALPARARTNLVAALRELGPDSDPQPARLMQFRAALDGSKAIFEAAFNEDNLTIGSLKQFVSNALNGAIPPAAITHDVMQTARGPVITLSYNSTDYLRVLLFGGGGSTWEESRVQCVAYLRNNIAEWETTE